MARRMGKSTHGASNTPCDSDLGAGATGPGAGAFAGSLAAEAPFTAPGEPSSCAAGEGAPAADEAKSDTIAMHARPGTIPRSLLMFKV